MGGVCGHFESFGLTSFKIIIKLCNNMHGPVLYWVGVVWVEFVATSKALASPHSK